MADVGIALESTVARWRSPPAVEGLADLMPSLRDTVYLGFSTGSMITSSSPPTRR